MPPKLLHFSSYTHQLKPAWDMFCMQATAAAAVAAASGGEQASQPAPAAARKWPGAKPLPLLLSVGVGLALRFLVPVPAGLTLQGWTLLSIFVSTIAGARPA
jgi:DASS family divalent anion:Na+ symporter